MAPSKHSRRSFLTAVAAAVVLPAATVLAADDLNALRRSGAVGERFDGFLVARQGSARATVDSINAQRRKIYEKRAKEAGVALEQIGRVYAEQIMKDAPNGTYFLQEGGQWVQK